MQVNFIFRLVRYSLRSVISVRLI